jgi:hypothetical protein
MEGYPADEEVIPVEITTRLTSRTAGFRLAFGSAARSVLGVVIATAVGLAALVVIGVVSWGAVRGLQGVCICGALGVAAGAALGRPESRAARVLGGGIGGVVAGYFAVASGEMLPIATTQSALGGASMPGRE